jgi:hypothetical protein
MLEDVLVLLTVAFHPALVREVLLAPAAEAE